jgi:hypothetical protein
MTQNEDSVNSGTQPVCIRRKVQYVSGVSVIKS